MAVKPVVGEDAMNVKTVGTPAPVVRLQRELLGGNAPKRGSASSASFGS